MPKSFADFSLLIGVVIPAALKAELIDHISFPQHDQSWHGEFEAQVDPHCKRFPSLQHQPGTNSAVNVMSFIRVIIIIIKKILKGFTISDVLSKGL